MKMGSLSFVSMLLFAIALLSFASYSAAKETDHFHTFSPIDEDDHAPVGYEPVTIFHGRVELPEWVVSVVSTVVDVPRVPKSDLPPPPHPDAPSSPRAPLFRPRSASAMASAAGSKKRSSAHQPAQAAPGEWLVMVDKSFRDDFLAVLEDMGAHLNQRFGMRQWLDVPAQREARRVHTERQQQRRSEGASADDASLDRPWRVDVRDNENGLQALEFDKRMMVKITVPSYLLEREEEVVESLRDMEWTEFIEPNIIVRATALATQTLDSSATIYPWGLDRIDQRDLPLNEKYQYPSSTSNVQIFVVDTGILATHQEFGSRATFGYNALGDGVDYDCNGHGTHVAGTAVGSTVGVAKSVSVVGVKVLNCSGDGTASDVISGITWATSNCPSGTNCLISLSLGGDGANSAMDAAVSSAYTNGLLAVSAAGNENVDACNVSPARSPYGIAVGATSQTDERAYFSNYGSCVSIFAPGVQITSSYIGSDSTYGVLSGTSQATPHVTGTAALYWGATNSGAGPSEVAGAIYASASINKLTNTGSGSPNRMLYSLVDLGDVPTTAYAACQINSCTTSNGTIATSATTTTVSVPSGQITVDSTTARYGYLQAWLTASVDFDLRLQYSSGGLWSTVATSSGSSGNEWIQYATSAKGAGYYRWQVVAAAGVSGAYSLSYQVPSSTQAGSEKTGGAASAVAPFWLSFYHTLF